MSAVVHPWLGPVSGNSRVGRLKHGLSGLKAGGTPDTGNPSFWADDATPWVAISDMSGAERVEATAKTVTQAGIADKRLEVLQPGTLLYSMYASLGHVSELAIPATTNQAILGLSFDERVSHRYAFWQLKAIQPYVVESASSNTQDNLNAEKVRNLPFAFPSRVEQERIANFLDEKTARIDALIAEKESLLERLGEYRLSVIGYAVSGGMCRGSRLVVVNDTWFEAVPEHWAFCPLNYRYEVHLGKMLDEKRITGDHLRPYLRNTDVQWGRINVENLPSMDILPDEQARYAVRSGDLLVCEGGEVGRAAIWEGPSDEVAYQKALHRVRPRSSSDLPRFMFYALLDSAKRGRFADREKATIAHLTAEAFRRYRFPFPPKNEQEAIVDYLDAQTRGFDDLQAHTLSHIARLREYRSSLISAAVTGQLRID